MVSSYEGREEWIVFDDYREQLKAVGVDVNDEDLAFVVEGHSWRTEERILWFLKNHHEFEDPTRGLIGAIRSDNLELSFVRLAADLDSVKA